ncbi:unnamed protein product [Amoebophrya sp. A25]|nr:unnamed protein product [Amoebophrya sp. A25]|eukprot:GSA25T00025811001.1
MTQLRPLHVGCVFALFYFVRTECSRALQLFVFSVIREAHAVFGRPSQPVVYRQSHGTKGAGGFKGNAHAADVVVHDLASFVTALRELGRGGAGLASARLTWLAEDPAGEGDALFSLLQDARALLGEGEGQLVLADQCSRTVSALIERGVTLESQKACFESFCALSEKVEKERRAITREDVDEEDEDQQRVLQNDNSCHAEFFAYVVDAARGAIPEAAASLRFCHLRVCRGSADLNPLRTTSTQVQQRCSMCFWR